MNTAFCFDLDGTITNQELLPLIAQEVQLFEEISALTVATLKGIIPFESSFRLRVKLLRDISIAKVREIVLNVGYFKKIVNFIKENTADCYVVTGNLDVWIDPLIERLGCVRFCSEASYQNDVLLGVADILDKGAAVTSLKKNYDRVVAVGDGMGDVAMFEHADVRVAFSGVHKVPESLFLLADYVSFDEDSLCNLLNTL